MRGEVIASTAPVSGRKRNCSLHIHTTWEETFSPALEREIERERERERERESERERAAVAAKDLGENWTGVEREEEGCRLLVRPSSSFPCCNAHPGGGLEGGIQVDIVVHARRNEMVVDFGKT